MDDDWDESSTPTFGGSNYVEPSSEGTSFSSKGRGFTRANNNEWNSGGGSRGGRGGGGFRGNRGGGSRGGFRSDSNGNGFSNNDESNEGGWGSGGGSRGRGGGRGGRGGFSSGGFGDNNGNSFGGGNSGNRPGDWTCPNTDCGHANWAKRSECMKCSEPKPAGDSMNGGSGGGGGDFNQSKPGEWTCPNTDCNHTNWAKRTNCQKCETAKPVVEGEKPREIYIPPEASNDEKEIFNTGISSGLNFDRYDDIDVQVTGEDIPKPITSFDNSRLRKLLVDNVKKSGYVKPTPIQKNSLPIIMAGRDLMACAQTGSGKTAAFLLPIINALLAEPQELISGTQSQPQAVIVSPTRELAIQINEECRKFSYDSGIKCVVTYGGTSSRYQADMVARGCHILVATPGRMNDFVTKNFISFDSVRFVVLDEADRMLDMGFLPAIEEMMNHTTMPATGERRTLMFSATFPEEIQHLAAKFLHNYVFVTIGIVGGACTDVEQKFYQVDKFKKRSKLLEILQTEGSERTLIFVETKRNADFLATYLSENNMSTTSIHGDRLQRERELALRDFKHGKHNILVATGVAARGLDIKNVQHVINFDLPKSIDEYVHRIGRTGRVGNKGKATSFFDDSQDGPISGDLARILKQASQSVPDWLGRGGTGSYSSSSFGGQDIRGDNYGAPAVATVEEEEW